jgi:hypothetical protein
VNKTHHGCALFDPSRRLGTIHSLDGWPNRRRAPIKLPSGPSGNSAVLLLGFSKKSSSQTKPWGDAIMAISPMSR